jgi:signal transduction histidine kinase
VKYSGATEVHLSANLAPLTLTIVIADNGAGFDVEGASAEGNGLRNLRERALALEGECRINSQPGTGTCLTLIVPWPHTGPVLPS